MPAPRVGLLFGGRSVEHEVSVISARSALNALRQTTLETIPLGVTPRGEWLSPGLSRALLEGPAARVEPGPDQDDGVRLALQPGGGLVRIGADGRVERLVLDVVLPLVHGWGGEDGRLQGALELAGVPYVGAGVLGSASAMSKVASKGLLQASGIPVVPWVAITRPEHARDPGRAARAAGELGYPVFVKPSNGGSSVGISRVATRDQLDAAMTLALAHDRVAVVERGLEAREIECAVLGNDPVEASGLGEIVPSGEFYDYDAKYIDNRSQLIIPAVLDPEITAEVRRLALRACRALDVSGFARVDFLIEKQGGEIFLNEINTLPGFTPISMFPKLWEAAGLAYPALVERLVRLALDAEG